jgi:hypothetical protein
MFAAAAAQQLNCCCCLGAGGANVCVVYNRLNVLILAAVLPREKTELTDLITIFCFRQFQANRAATRLNCILSTCISASRAGIRVANCQPAPTFELA